MATIGQMIGKVEHTFKTTNDHEESCTITVKFDFANCKDSDVKAWLVSNRAIIMQRPLRALSVNEIKALNGQVVDASQCGKKVKSKHEQVLAGIAALRASGVKEIMAQADQIEAEYNAAQEAKAAETASDDDNE